MYFLENYNIYNHHTFIQLAGLKKDRVTFNPLYNGMLTVFDSYNFNDTKQRGFIKSLIDNRKKRNLPTNVLYDYSYETGMGDHEIERYVNEMRDAGMPSSNISFVLHKGATTYIPNSINKYRFYFLDHFALKLYAKYASNEIKAARKRLVDRKIAINIMVAQLHWKKTRLHTLYHLYKANLLQTAITGILTLKENISTLEHEIPDDGFWQWLYDHLGPADDVDVRMGHDALISSGFPYSIDTYNNSRVTHICETLCKEMRGPASFLTEKTYKPILNMSPFVLQGGEGHLEYLQSQGFHVFDKYIDIEYDKTPFDFNLIPKTVQATRELLIATIDYPDEIEISTQHNFRMLLSIGKQEYTLLRKFLGEK